MPRGICDNCEDHDAFVFAIASAAGTTVFLCAACLSGLYEEDDEEDQDEGSNEWNEDDEYEYNALGRQYARKRQF